MIKLWRFLSSLPTLAYAGAGAVAMVALLWLWHGSAVTVAYARGRADVLASARFDSAAVALTIEARARAMARTDTVRDTVHVRVERVRDVASRVPDTVRVAFPVVDTLAIESQRLTAVVDRLTRQIDTERAAATMALDVALAQVTEARLVNVAQADTIVQLKKRPRWRTAITGALLTAAGGFAAGAWR